MTTIQPLARTVTKRSTRVEQWPEEEGHPRRWAILAVLAAVAFMAQLDLFIVNIAIPSMTRSFGGAGLSGLSWVLNAYAIVFAALLVPAGRLADHFGRRRFLLGGVVVFSLGSILCALAPTLSVLIGGRIVQAVGAAVIVPASLGLLLPAFASRHHSLAVGIWAGVAAVAASSGAPLGGLLVSISWRWIFIVNVPIGLATLIFGSRLLPEIKASSRARLPRVSSVLALLGAVTFLVLATVQGPTWGWGSLPVLALFGGSALAMAVTVIQTRRGEDALLETSLFASREFSTAAAGLFLYYLAFAVFLLITVLFLQDMWHYSALRAGLAIAPGPALAAVFAVNTGRVSARFGRTATATAGALAIGLSGLYWLLFATESPSYLTAFLPGLLIGGVGAGLAQAPLFAAASTLPADRTTTGSAVLNMSRQVGSAVGVAILVALLAGGHPKALSLFHRGWILEMLAALGAALSVAVPRTGTRLAIPFRAKRSRAPVELAVLER
ncbi:MAG TPA: MFS transporter [Solirubrobacteraceae bacterium]|jgi:EmrB/QacA subfamily drug resistance transporter|nr:MFS transporter [Solirubrobacteraceae bacterium]